MATLKGLILAFIAKIFTVEVAGILHSCFTSKRLFGVGLIWEEE